MELRDARDLLDRQAGVVGRRQLLERGASTADLRRWLRRRELVTVHPGVYVNHTGPLTWANRAWAGVVLHWPAALSHESAVHLAGEVVHVAVDASRTPVLRRGIMLHLLADLEGRVLWNLGPPRLRFEDALISLCAQAPGRTAALALASEACRRRRTTPQRLLGELEHRRNVRHRRWLRDVFCETAEGIQSALESSYLRRVERSHGLPRPQRQLREHTGGGAVVYRDVDYERYRLVVELDGRIGHELDADRWRDMDRDLDVALEGRMTIRIGWRHTEDRPCETADRLGRVLQLRGWQGRVRRCGPGCRIGPPIGATG